MTNNQIANILNTQVVPNILGATVTIAEDLSNIVDLGVLVDDMDADTLKDIAGRFAVGVVKVWTDDRAFTKHKELGLMTDAQEYAGALQRVRSGLYSAVDSHINTLERAEVPIDYNDGTYYPMTTTARIFQKSVSHKIPFSISTNQIKSYFSSAEGVQMFTSLIYATVDRTISCEAYGLQLAMLGKLAVTQYSGGKKIQLITQYNAEHGLQSTDDGYINTANYKNHPEFFHWVAQVIDRLKSRIGNISKLFNDESIETFTPESDVRITLLNEFASDNKFANVYTFNKEIVEFSGYNTVDFWQNLGTDILPSMGVTAEVKETTTDDDPVTISGLVGLVYDRTSCLVTTVIDKITSAYIGSEDFTNFYHHYVMKYFVDPQANAIALVLE